MSENPYAEFARKLGPERCQSALRAFDLADEERCGWDNCVIAQAYGPPRLFLEHYGEAYRHLRDMQKPLWLYYSCEQFAADALGVSEFDVGDVIRVFDHSDLYPRCFADLHAALQAEARKIATPKGLTGRVEPDPPDYPWLRKLRGEPPKDGGS